MLSIGGQTTMLTYAAVGLLVVGLILLFFGVKLVRLIYMLMFATLGAAVGRVAALFLEGRVAVPHLPWVAAIGGAVVLGLLGFLLFRVWVTLSFGGLLSWLAAIGYLCYMAPGSLAQLRPAVQEASLGAVDAATVGQQILSKADPEDIKKFEEISSRLVNAREKHESEVPITTEDMETLDRLSKPISDSGPDGAARVKRMATRSAAYQDVFKQTNKIFGDRNLALGMAVAAVVGLMVGLLIGGLAWRLAAVLMTSLWGLTLTVLGLAGLCYQHKPEALTRVQQMGWKALIGLAGLWLMGLAVQGLLARRRKAAPLAQPV